MRCTQIFSLSLRDREVVSDTPSTEQEEIKCSTGKAELAEVDGPYVKLRLSGKFWHKRSTVVARLGNYLKQRIPVSIY